MENSSNEYRISFFKPSTPQAVRNRNMVVWLVLIWAIAIFGFQILLKVIEEPTPQPAYLKFQDTWENVQQEKPQQESLKQFGQSLLSVLGKVDIEPGAKSALDDALSWTVYQLTADTLRETLISTVEHFEQLKAQIEKISDEEYIEAKFLLAKETSPLLGILHTDVKAKILPLGLTSVGMGSMTNETIENLPGIMEKYLIHNRSVLTDSKFLGFPFHYFYTAVFLLILFVGLCWLYCVRTDKMNAKLNIAD